MAPKNNEHFASTVREAMSRLGLTQAGVSERGGPSDTTLRKILENEPVGISTATLSKLDKAFEWDPGSAAATLAGGQPTISGTLRGSSGDVLNSFTALEGHEQHLLEQLMLGKLLGDAREFVHRRPGIDNNLLARSLDEAYELAVRALSREQDYSISDAEWRINEERAANSIRRQGSIYVVAKPTVADHDPGDAAAKSSEDAEADAASPGDSRGQARLATNFVLSESDTHRDEISFRVFVGRSSHPDDISERSMSGESASEVVRALLPGLRAAGYLPDLNVTIGGVRFDIVAKSPRADGDDLYVRAVRDNPPHDDAVLERLSQTLEKLATAAGMSDDDLRNAAAADKVWADYIKTRRPELADGWDF